jgi:NitT/TauT family transport system substrate-binding protein
MTDKINMMVLRHSAFYSPLLYTLSGGFLKAQGLEASYQIATPEKTIAASLKDGSVHLAQLAVAASFPELERGEQPDMVHFAQINQRDGFFIAGKSQTAAFDWQQLIGKKILVDHLFQPLAMFKYALQWIWRLEQVKPIISINKAQHRNNWNRKTKPEFSLQSAK